MLRLSTMYTQVVQLSHCVRMSLTRMQAEHRSKHVRAYIQNTLQLQLNHGLEYNGLLTTQFKLTTPTQDIFLDYQGDNVQSIQLNGHTVDTNNQRDNKIYLPSHLLAENNTVIIQFNNKYSTTGNGLHSFIDKSDHSQYIYSQCEPYHASKMFPCFDQPDLKGHFKLIAHAPKEWRIISNEVEIPAQIQLPKIDNYKITEFANSQPLSTYLYAVLAGPYVEIKCPSQLMHRNIPQSLYCRKALQQYVESDTQELFSLTSRGMDYFEKLFGYSYPFSKYDQIFCPEYSTGAMENAGAVTINDLYVFKEEVPKSQRASRANTILHELSHMWFGDLVTMKWWDDLWLNESFAEFISHLCQDSISNDVNYWVQFLERKQWGYLTDEKPTTHPIYCEIQNVHQAENIFDGITYAKGAALLKQIYYVVGQEHFSKSMSEYFNKYAYKNTTLADFFGVMRHVQGVNWEEFKQDWIMESGVNSITVECRDGVAIFHQSGRFLRKHSFKIAILNDTTITTQQVIINKESSTSIQLNDINENSVIIINYDDQSYVKATYTPQQTKYLLQNLNRVPNSLNRLLILQSVYDQVRDGKTCFNEFVNGVVNHINNEDDDTVSKLILQWCAVGINYYTPLQLRPNIREKLVEQVGLLIAQTNDKNKQLVLKGYIVGWSKTKERLSNLQTNIATLGIKDGWTMIYNTFIYDDHKWELYEQLAAKDADHHKHKRFLEALAQRTTLWNYFVNYDKGESVQQAAQAMRAFNHEHFSQDLVQYEDQFFDSLISVFNRQDSEYAKSFYNNLYPVGDNLAKYQIKCQQILSSTNNDFLIKLLKESMDTNSRRIKAYETYNY